MRQETDESKQRAAIGKRAGLIGLLCNFLLAGGKLAVGTLAASMAIFADGLNNLSDGASSLVTLLGFKLGERPADPEHPYGHARYEYLAALTVAVMILVIGVELAKSSLHKILNPAPIAFSWLMLAVLVGSILVKAWMMFFYKKQGEKISSTTLLAASEDSRNDVLTTAAVLAAVLVEKLSGWQIDGIMGILVAAFILFSGAKLAKETLSPLLGEGATKELARQVTAYIRSFPLVLGCHDLMVHDYGPGRRYASLHVELDSREDPMACHELIDDMERGCLKELGIHLVIHYDPLITDDAELNRLQQLVSTLLKVRDPRISIHDFRLRHQEDRSDLSFDIVLPPNLWGQEESIRTAVEEALDTLEGKPYHLDVTFDLGDSCQDA
jgi:cation diffusion facilitator family transporter